MFIDLKNFSESSYKKKNKTYPGLHNKGINVLFYFIEKEILRKYIKKKKKILGTAWKTNSFKQKGIIKIGESKLKV